MKNVAITGASGYLGGLLLPRLDAEAGVERIVALDVRPPSFESPNLKFYQRDVRQPFTDIFAENDIDTAMHLAFQVHPIHDETGSHSINIEGTKNFLDACEGAGVSQMFLMSSYTAYGARADNPELITEDAPLRPVPGFLYPNDKAKVDEMFQQYQASHADTCVTTVRTVAVAGPNVVAGGLTTLFLPVMLRAWGHDPLWQFVHEEDLVEVVALLLKQRQAGVFNVAGDGGLRYTEMIKALGKPSIALPGGPLAWLTTLSWRLRLQSRSPGGVDILTHPLVVSTEKVKKATGYRFRHTGDEAFMEFVESRRKPS